MFPLVITPIIPLVCEKSTNSSKKVEDGLLHLLKLPTLELLGLGLVAAPGVVAMIIKCFLKCLARQIF